MATIMATTVRTTLTETAEYLAVPVPASDRPGPWPGVVMVHDLFGLGDDMKEQADWLAAAGYLTVVPDLYQGRGAIRCVQGAFRQLAAQHGPIYDLIDQARTDLAAHRDCTGDVGIIGYCMGGGFALVTAGRPGWKAAAVNYEKTSTRSSRHPARSWPASAARTKACRERPVGSKPP